MALALLTADLPGTGGVLKREPEDFRVDEVPLYLPCGEGEHTYFRLWKRGLATFEAVRRVAQALGLSERDVGYAGLKDTRAVTTQWISVPGIEPERIEQMVIPSASVLDVKRHGNRIKIGHLRGNRFDIVVRDAVPDALDRAAAVLEVLQRRGAPNYFGKQRFGTRGASHLCGEAILRKDHDAFVRRLLGGPPGPEKDPALIEARRLFDEGRIAEAYEAMPTRLRAEKKCLHALLRFKDTERAYFSIPKRIRQIFVSAYQSHLFNGILDRRVPRIDTVDEGDLAYLHRNGAVFVVEDVETEQERCRTFEISPSGPLFGTKVPLAGGEAGEHERAVLAETGLALRDFDPGGGLRIKGQRRSLRIPLADTVLEPVDATSYRVKFQLPSGAFATSIMRELMKPGPA